MKEIEGIRGAFRQAKVVYMTTFKNREKNSRHMTNLNEDPYKMI